VIKERNTDQAHRYQLWKLENQILQLECILGSGLQTHLELDGEGVATFKLDGPFAYALFKYSLDPVSSPDLTKL
jgi:hypothetical protein